MKIVALICRILLGLMFVVFGLNGLHNFLHMPSPNLDSTHAAFVGQYFGSVAASGWMNFVYVCQLVGGLLVLIGRTAPAGLCILAAILVNILCFHIFIMGGTGVAPALIALALWLIVFYSYRAHFAGIVSTSATPAA
jgi:putative oxidoreductase